MTEEIILDSLSNQDGVRVTVNCVDMNQNGHADLLSFVGEKGSIGMAVIDQKMHNISAIYIFQDITGDGMLDEDDETRLRDMSEKILHKYSGNFPSHLDLLL